MDGQNIFLTKRTPRNLLKDIKKKRVRSRQALERLKGNLSGTLEYDSPSASINFSGAFKLDKDPKVSSLSFKNMLFAGTKLCSTWVMGLVIYNGASTKIL